MEMQQTASIVHNIKRYQATGQRLKEAVRSYAAEYFGKQLGVQETVEPRFILRILEFSILIRTEIALSSTPPGQANSPLEMVKINASLVAGLVKKVGETEAFVPLGQRLDFDGYGNVLTTHSDFFTDQFLTSVLTDFFTKGDRVFVS
jgi:hypothetical protein